MLFIHGGPSMPMPSVSCRGLDYVLITTTKELVKHFAIVYWDQRGTGKSYSNNIPKESINLKQFVSDGKEVVDYLRKHLNQDKIHLIGYSWGTVISLLLVYQYPEKFYSYTAFSQITKWAENDYLIITFVIHKNTREL